MGPFDPMSQDGNKYVAVAVDAFTKFVEAKGKAYKFNDHKTSLQRHVDHDTYQKMYIMIEFFQKCHDRIFFVSPFRADKP